MQIEIDGLVLEHRINRRLKHAYLSIEPDGTLLLKSNGKNMGGLHAFVASKREWIEKKRALQREKPAVRLGEGILYLGEIIPLADAPNIKKYDLSEARMRESYHRQYRLWAEAYIVARTAEFAASMGVDYGAIRFRRMQRRWGSCSKSGDLTFNTLLMQLPKALIDYTIVHELAHRSHFNHSADFHAAVRRVLPDENARRRQMRAWSVTRY